MGSPCGNHLFFAITNFAVTQLLLVWHLCKVNERLNRNTMNAATTTINTMKDNFEYISQISRPSGDLVIEQTANSPFVRYNKQFRSLSIIGESYIADSRAFYQPLFIKIYDDLLTHGHAKVELNFTSFCPKTVKMIFELLGNLRHYKRLAKDIEIVWKTNGNKVTEELGHSLAELFELDIKISK